MTRQWKGQTPGFNKVSACLLFITVSSVLFSQPANFRACGEPQSELQIGPGRGGDFSPFNPDALLLASNLRYFSSVSCSSFPLQLKNVFQTLCSSFHKAQMSHSEPNVLVCLVSKSPSVMSYAVTTGVLNEVESLWLFAHISPDLSHTFIWFSKSEVLKMGSRELQGFVKHSQEVHDAVVEITTHIKHQSLLGHNVLYQWKFRNRKLWLKKKQDLIYKFKIILPKQVYMLCFPKWTCCFR